MTGEARLGEYMILFIQAVLACFMLAVIVYDASRFIIPNWLVGTLLALWPVMWLVTPYDVEWQPALIAFGATFAVGIVLFIFRLMGGGDIKLLAVCALWVGGMPQIAEFLAYTGILGGALALGLLMLRPLVFYMLPAAKTPRVLKKDEPVPYGLAIAAAFLILLWNGQIPGVH